MLVCGNEPKRIMEQNAASDEFDITESGRVSTIIVKDLIRLKKSEPIFLIT